jgi:glutaredoxin
MKKIVYKFFRDSCSPCYNLSRILNVINIPDDVEIVPKNVGEENNKTLAKSYGIDKVPALIFEDGRKIIGNLTKDQVIDFLSV